MYYNGSPKGVIRSAMLINELLNVDADIDVRGIGYGDVCREKDLYFCLHSGDRLKADIIFAESHGAAAIVCPSGAAEDFRHIPSDDVRRDLALASAEFYGRPADRLTMIGVTGK